MKCRFLDVQDTTLFIVERYVVRGFARDGRCSTSDAITFSNERSASTIVFHYPIFQEEIR
jgi:hypothetical protein